MPEPINLTPEEVSAYEQAAQQQQSPTPVNPIRDLSPEDLFSLATQDKEFDLVNEFRRNKDLWGDQNLVRKVADVHERIKQRGFQTSDIPSLGKMAHTAFDIAKGFGKQLWNYSNAIIGVPLASAIGEVTGDAKQPGFNTELAQEGQRRVMENLAGTESGMFGVAQLGKKALNTVKKSALTHSGVEEVATPEQKVSNLWSDVGVGDISEEITKGKGGFLTPIGANVRTELEAAGKPIRPEEVQTLAAGDPLSFYTYGRAFGGVGRAVQGARSLLPEGVTKAVEATAAKLPSAEKVAGKAVEASGTLLDLGGRAVKVAGPTVGFVKGAMTGGPIGALAGLKGGEIAAKLGNKISKIGEGVKAAGKEVAGETPVTSATGQLAKDVASAVPSTVAEVGKGLAFDIGTAALTSESPHDTQSVGIGAFFGGMNAAKRAGGRIISGQIVAPREWGVDKYVPPSGQVDSSFENMHISATKNAPPAVKVRLNAIRQFLKGSHADTDVFLAKDSQSLEQTLTQSGISPAQAKTLAQQEGFFTANIPGKNGGMRRVIIARNVDAAPHEAFHAIQDVLGEDANQHIDQIVRQEYGPQWEQEGQRYADRIAPGGDWRETILDSTGTGLNYAKEKIAMEVGNEYRNATGAEPTSEYVQTRTKEVFGQKMDAALQSNPNIDPNQIAQHVWRDVLSPQEATAIADSYLARELAAENFDMVFKNLGTALQNPGLPGRLARVVANLVSTLGGGEPLSPEVTSEIGQISPKFKVTEAVRLAPHLVQPKAGAVAERPEILPTNKPKGPSEPLLPSPKPHEVKTPETEVETDPAKIAAEAPTTPVAGGTASPRELLGTIAEAIAQRAGVKINYLSAPEEPAAATTSNRDVRRQMIEAFRTMPPEARLLWEKTFFPERVLKLKGDKYQVLGWAPEVFAANAHKLAAKLEELGVADASPYPIKDGTFTSEGWQELYRDVQKFVQNQMGGRTGAGDTLVVPKGLPGMSAPPEKGAAVALDQTRADMINMLFNFRLPDTARVQKGKLPLNIAGQEVSEATKPGRTSIPIIPRGSFEGAEAERQGIAGRPIKEVNPLRQQIEAAAQSKGVPMPEFIEAIQRLNLENIKDVQVATEAPEFRGNTLTLSAGFQPSPKPRAIRAAAIRDEKGKIWEGMFHGTAEALAREGGARGPYEEGFVTNSEEFLNRKEAFQRAKELDQLNPEANNRLDADYGLEASRVVGSEAETFLKSRFSGKFQPPKNAEQAEELVKAVAKMSPQEFDKWAHETPDGLTEAAYHTGLNAPTKEFVQFLKVAAESFGKRALELISTNPEEGMAIVAQQQFFHEAWEAATGEGSAGFALRKEQPGYKPKFPVNVNKSDDNLHNKVLDSAPETSDNVGNMSNQLQPKKAAKKETKPVFRTGLVSKDGAGYWVDPNGELVRAPETHKKTAYELNKAYNLNIDLVDIDKKGDNAVYDAMNARKYLRAYNVGNNILAVEGPTKWEYVSRAQREKLEDAVVEGNFTLYYNDKKIETANSLGNDNLSTETFRKSRREMDRLEKELRDKRSDSQLQPKKAAKKEFKMKPAQAGFSKAWILPDGTPIQLGGKWHHEFINESADLRRKYNLPVDENTEQNRIEALKEGFVRINWADQSGRITIEAREKDWAKQRPAVRNFVERNAEKIDHIKVILFNDGVTKISNSGEEKVFDMDDIEKPAMIPFLDLDAKRATGDASDRLFQKAVDRASKAPAGKFPVDEEPGAAFWVGPDGTIHNAPHDHEMKAYELNRDGIVTLDLDDLARKIDAGGFEELYNEMSKRKFLRGYTLDKGEVALEGPGRWEHLPRAQREAMEDAASASGVKLYYNNKPVETTESFPEVGAMFQPKKDEFLRTNTWRGKQPLAPRNVAYAYAKKAGIDYVPLPDRQFAEQKNVVVPDEMLNEVRAQFQPTEEMFYARHYRKSGGPFWSYDESVGPMSKEAAEKFLDTIKKINSNTGQYHSKYSIEESVPEGSRVVSGKDWLDSSRISDETSKELATQLQPRRADEDLFGQRQNYTKSEVSKMTRAELKEAFPEAIVPRSKDESIPSDIIGSPLFKRAGNEEAAVEAFADGLENFAKENRNDPVFKAGVAWYDEFAPMLKKEFGEQADLFAELLAATSPQTNVETNFAYAVDAIESLKAGRFNKIIPKFNEGLEKIENGTWEKWYNKELPNIPEPPQNPTPAAFLEHWIFKHNLKPRQTNGKLYGIHSLPVLQVFARKWLTEARGPKTLNFVENLLGKGEEATIDVWADRTMRRIGYKGLERWRILPKNISGVTDKDFAFAQKAYRAAAQRLGMKPSALQAALWFAEKKLWAENGWSPLDLGDFRNEMKKLPMLRQGFQSRLTSEKKAAKVRPAEALDLGLIQPR